MSTVVNYWRFLIAQWQVNLSSAMAYRQSFLVQTVFMILNDIFLLFFWWVLLQVVPDIGGADMSQIWLMYGLSAGGYGLLVVLFGNTFNLSQLISEGQLDYYLALPKNPLLHILVSQTNFSGVGDLAFGLVIGAMGCQVNDASYGLFLFFMLTSAAILGAFVVIVQSMAFFIGRAEAVSQQLSGSILSLSMYPGGIYRGFSRFLITFIIPAGLMVHLPVTALLNLHWRTILLVALAAIILWLLAVLVFRAGLRRYESGNQMLLRG